MEKEEFWYDNPNIVTNLIIGLIAIIVILSQSFAINNNLTTGEILRNIVNHNSIYFISLVYFVALKTYTGKKYFNFLNLFLILFYLVTSITSFLTIFQTFSLSTLISLALHVVLLLYLFHTFLRRTRVWKEFKLDKSPFNEIKNDAYFYIVIVLGVSLLSLNLIFCNTLDGAILAFLDTCYIVLFARYIYLYGYFLDVKEKKKNMNTTMDEVVDKFNEVKNSIENNEFVSNVCDKVNKVVEDANLVDSKDKNVSKKSRPKKKQVKTNTNNKKEKK